VRSTSPTTNTIRGPTTSSRKYVTRATSGAAIRALIAAARTWGSASWPTRNRRLRLIKTTATTASSTPIRIDPTASGTGEPVSWWMPSPAAAMTTPTRAAESSANTARSVGSEVASTWSMRSRCIDSASGLACRTDRRNEVPSRTNETASTMYPMTKSLAFSG